VFITVEFTHTNISFCLISQKIFETAREINKFPKKDKIRIPEPRNQRKGNIEVYTAQV
jgi:hypothetical protein